MLLQIVSQISTMSDEVYISLPIFRQVIPQVALPFLLYVITSYSSFDYQIIAQL